MIPVAKLTAVGAKCRARMTLEAERRFCGNTHNFDLNNAPVTMNKCALCLTLPYLQCLFGYQQSQHVLLLRH